MSLKKAFELSETIYSLTRHLVSDLEKHNPGLSCKQKPCVSSINLDVAILQSKLELLHSLISEQILSEKWTT